MVVIRAIRLTTFYELEFSLAKNLVASVVIFFFVDWIQNCVEVAAYETVQKEVIKTAILTFEKLFIKNLLGE